MWSGSGRPHATSLAGRTLLPVVTRAAGCVNKSSNRLESRLGTLAGQTVYRSKIGR